MNQSIPNRTDLAIIGAGHAGVELATVLRQKGFTGDIDLVSDEDTLPYDRPPLSKTLLAGKVSAERIALRAQSFFDKHRVRLHTGHAVTALDADAGRLVVGDRSMTFERCVLATGAGARSLPLPGIELAGVHTLRHLRDALGLREALRPGLRLVVIGGGYLGLEAASTARALGATVTVLEAADALMPGKVSAAVAKAYAALHREAGTRLCLASGARRLLGDDHVSGVETTAGEVLPADAVLVAVGAVPNTSLAEQAGLACDDGILVDTHLCAVPGRIYAIGDCARPLTDGGQRPRRMESVHNAVSQARLLAAEFLGLPPPALRAPYFWSEQEGVKLQVAGQLAVGLPDEQHRVGEDPRAFSVYRLQAGTLACIEAVGDPAAFVRGQRLIGRAGIGELPATEQP